ncbi:MAG: hypothetical protein ACE365_05315 [Gammaproteobacteria bacterium]
MSLFEQYKYILGGNPNLNSTGPRILNREYKIIKFLVIAFFIYVALSVTANAILHEYHKTILNLQIKKHLEAYEGDCNKLNALREKMKKLRIAFYNDPSIVNPSKLRKESGDIRSLDKLRQFDQRLVLLQEKIERIMEGEDQKVKQYLQWQHQRQVENKKAEQYEEAQKKRQKRKQQESHSSMPGYNKINHLLQLIN